MEPANGVTGYKWVKKSEVTAFIFSCGDWTISLGVVYELFGLEKALVKLSLDPMKQDLNKVSVTVSFFCNILEREHSGQILK